MKWLRSSRSGLWRSAFACVTVLLRNMCLDSYTFAEYFGE